MTTELPNRERSIALAGTVLVVEDDHDIRVAVRNTLEDEGYRVLSVTDGHRALELLEQSSDLPDLILLDLMMPLMNGWTFAERIRATPRWSGIPVAVISAYDGLPPSDVVAFLRKPLRREALLDLAERFCRNER